MNRPSTTEPAVPSAWQLLDENDRVVAVVGATSAEEARGKFKRSGLCGKSMRRVP